MKQYITALLLTCAFCASSPLPAHSSGRVMVIPIDGEIELGVAPFVERSTIEAND